MGQWGAAFGIPFAVEGLFFFVEAIFIAIYIFGWKRLRPWPHFWTGVPIVLSGIGGTLSVVAANAWMNEPAGFTLNKAGEVVDVDPLKVIFNEAWPYEASHMLVAAYLVGGFMVASVYAVGMLRGRRDRYHRLGFLIPFTVAAIATPDPDGGRRHAGPLGLQQRADQVRRDRARARDRERRARDAARPPRLRRQRHRRASDPGPGLVAVRSRHGHEHRRSRASTRSPPTSARRPRQVNTVHLAWDVMVGLGTLLFLLSAWYWARWIFRRDMPQSKLFLRLASVAGVAAVLAMEAGWVVTEVGRQPWIVRGHMKVEEAATTNERRLDHVHRRGLHLPGLGDDRGPGAAQHEPAVPAAGRASSRATSPTARARLPPDGPAGRGARRWLTPSRSCCSWR